MEEAEPRACRAVVATVTPAVMGERALERLDLDVEGVGHAFSVDATPGLYHEGDRVLVRVEHADGAVNVFVSKED